MTFNLIFLATGLAMLRKVSEATDEEKADYLASFPLYAALFLIATLVSSFVVFICIGVLTHP